MAFYNNGQSHQGQYTNAHENPNPTNPYGSHLLHRTPQQQNMRRPPSSDTGVDTRNPDGTRRDQGDYMPGGASYRPGSNAGTQHEELYIGTPSPPLANNISTFHSVGGYQHEDTPPTPRGVTASNTYNPQQYPRPQSQYSPQTHSNVISNQSASHQPYIPAAYQATSLPVASSHASQHYESSPITYGSPSLYQLPTQIPPLLPRPPEQPYGNRRVSQNTTPSLASHLSYQQDFSYRHAPLPPLPGNAPLPSHTAAYTPPAPPPPPFSPIRDAFSSNVSFAAPARRYTHNNSSSQDPTPQFGNSRQASQSQLPSLPNCPSGSSGTPAAQLPWQVTSPWQTPGGSSPSTPGPTPPQHSPQRSHQSVRHPHARPLPGPPTSESDGDYFGSRNGLGHDGSNEESGYEEIMKEVEAAVMGRGPSSSTRRQSPRVERINYRTPINEEEEPEPLFSGDSHTGIRPDSVQTHTNGIGTTDTGDYPKYAAYSDESDAEAAAGLAAMQMAEEQEAADEARRHSAGTGSINRIHGSQGSSRFVEPSTEMSSDSDVNIDMGTYGGGFPDYHYGDESLLQAQYSDPHVGQEDVSGAGQSNISGEALDMMENSYLLPDQDEIHPFPMFGARVDTGGTGGLSEPSSHPRRLSFEDGDEATLVDSERGQISSSERSSNDYTPLISSYPARGSSRPLPRLPHLSTSESYRPRRQTDQYGRPLYPLAPDEYEQSYTPSGTPVHKANSIGSTSSTPVVVPPGRSITDAEQRRRQQLAGIRVNPSYDSSLGPDSSGISSGKLMDIDLPTIPVGKRSKFNPAKLSTNDFKKCIEPWALSSILAWIKDMTEGAADLKEQSVTDGIVALFTHKVPTMNIADAETLSSRLVKVMIDCDALLREEEWVRFGSESMSGVLFQLTGTGCYSPRVHLSTLPGRCYSHHCMRTLKKINLQTQILEPQRKAEDWATFYKLKKADIEGKDKKEVERQNNLHEIVTTEDSFMDQLNVLRILYRDELAKSPQPILQPKYLSAFLKNVFGKADAIKEVNEEYLLAQLKYRQQEQGPWIVGFSDIFREWIRKAKTAYVEYAASFPNATLLVRKEADTNVLFRQFLDQIRENERSKRLGWDTYLKAPITRLQRYTLLLSTVHKHMVHDSEEKLNLQKAIEEIKAVTLECDTRVAEMSKHVDLADLAEKLRLRDNMEVQLNLTHLGREIIFQGDLQRPGTKSFNWLETHAILFDHYLVLAKRDTRRDDAIGMKREIFDVSKLPIPMDLLVLESANDDPVVKSSVKGIGSVTTVTSRAQAPQEARLGRVQSNQSGTGGPGTLLQSNTSSSVISNSSGRSFTSTTTILDSPKDENVMYPFRIKHLGNPQVYNLYAPSAQNRQDWCDKIILAKTRHAASLFAQGAEPFKLRVMADAAFAYDTISGGGALVGARTVLIKGTPLDRAIREVEAAFDRSIPRPGPACRAVVNCATAFHQPYGSRMVAVGTDFGVFISEYTNPRGWSRVITATRVTQITVLEEFSLFLVIADKALIAYHLDAVCPVSSTPNVSSDSSSRRAPQKLSGSRDVGFFATGRMKDRALVFYKKRDGISSTFKVLEPVFQKSSTSSRSRFGMRKGTTEFFRDFDDFYIPSETYAINLFQSSLAIATAKGFEVMTLDKKVPLSIPDLKPQACAKIAGQIRDQKPLGMFRISDTEFLLVFEATGVYINKHGDISRAVVMNFVGKAKQAALYKSTYLLLVDPGMTGTGYVEVRNAMNGRLRQVVSGRDVKLLDDGMNGGTVKICMQHPEMERSQIVLEMIVNEGLKE